ncbi:Galactosyl transferase GMA12/MNN10 family protein [Actinidia rufa]|uniref:Galactosyl transferase GMA12/MNN10 family protein n=1 Tax=Actinidia rufa TaxID=165716 RepID=A0A7J0FM37_9ERIC|nr:Galactosyl transferase GMA12/MNN10 family protein [Actinidia rufa]
MSYSIDTRIKDWDVKRRDWLEHHPVICAGDWDVVLSGSQSWPCKNPMGDHLLLRLSKNKVDLSDKRLRSVLQQRLVAPEDGLLWGQDLSCSGRDGGPPGGRSGSFELSRMPCARIWILSRPWRDSLYKDRRELLEESERGEGVEEIHAEIVREHYAAGVWEAIVKEGDSFFGVSTVYIGLMGNRRPTWWMRSSTTPCTTVATLLGPVLSLSTHRGDVMVTPKLVFFTAVLKTRSNSVKPSRIACQVIENRLSATTFSSMFDFLSSPLLHK